MKIIFTAVALSFLLTGCGAVQQAEINSAMQKTQQEVSGNCTFYEWLSQKEAQAWLDAGKDIGQNCKGADKTPSPDRMKEVADCGTKIVNQGVKPVVFSQKEFADLMSARDNEINQYVDGKISWEQETKASNERMGKYFKEFRKAGNGSYYLATQCADAIMAKNLPSSYTHRALLSEYFADAEAFARRADKEKMEPEDVQIEQQKLWAQFAEKEQQENSQMQAQQAAAWHQTGQAMQQMGAAILQANKPQPIQPVPDLTPKTYHTSCNANSYGYGTNVTCTTHQ